MRRIALSLVSLTALAVAGCSAPSDTAVAQSEAAPAPLREGTTPIQASDSYYQSAAEAVETRIQERGVKSAKNIILFVGDGMSIPTITAARIYAGQQRGLDGESYTLAMDTLPYMALSKTYSHDYQVSDSASTATAMVTGAKVNSRTLGILKEAGFGNCASASQSNGNFWL